MSTGSNSISAVIKRHFISGVLVVVPVILTYLVLKFLFEAIDGILQPLLFRVLGYSIPGLGFFTTLLLIILAGLLTRNFIGVRLFRLGDKLLNRLPIIRPIYSAAKQVLEAVAMPTMSAFKSVALIEYPRPGAFALCFVSNKFTLKDDSRETELVSVFVPSTPTPISGMVIMVPEADVIRLDMNVEDGIKFLVSGGVVCPDLLTRTNSVKNNQ